MSASVSDGQPTLTGYVRLCQQQWKLIASLVVAAAVAAGAISIAHADVYEASSTVRFTKSTSLEHGAEVARSERTHDAAARASGTQSEVSATSAGPSTLRLTVEGENPRRVARAANAYAAAVVRSVADGAKVSSRADVPTTPSRPTTARNGALGAAFGLTLSLGLVLVRSKL